MAQYKYPSDIEKPEFKNRRIKLNVYEYYTSKDAQAAINTAKDIVQNFNDLLPSANDTVSEMAKNLKATSGTRIRGNLLNSIVLPMPNNFQDNQSHSWSTESGIIGTVGTSLTNASVGSSIKRFFPNAPNFLGNIDLSIDKVIGATANSFGTRRPIIDPGYFQNYSGSEPRSFSTEFNFIPSSAEEAESILAIIMKLKQYSAPQRGIGGVSLKAPYYFGIEFSNKYIQSMIKVDRLVLKNLIFEYGADGAMQMTGDGIPKFITMSLSWQEVDLTTADEYSHVPKVKEKI